MPASQTDGGYLRHGSVFILYYYYFVVLFKFFFTALFQHPRIFLTPGKYSLRRPPGVLSVCNNPNGIKMNRTTFTNYFGVSKAEKCWVLPVSLLHMVNPLS